jgi:hypothetical protein
MGPAAFGAAIEHPGPAPQIAVEGAPSLSLRARLALGWRACHGPVAFAIAVVPAGLAFGPERSWLLRLLLLAAAAAIFMVVRGALRSTVDLSSFARRERDCRRRWQSELARWEAEAGPRLFDAKTVEIGKLSDWWRTAEASQRWRIEAAIRRGIDELHEIAYRIQLARTALRPDVEKAQAALRQAELDLARLSRKR